MTKPPRVGICLGRSKAYLCLKFLGRSRPRLIHFLKIRPLRFCGSNLPVELQQVSIANVPNSRNPNLCLLSTLNCYEYVFCEMSSLCFDTIGAGLYDSWCVFEWNVTLNNNTFFYLKIKYRIKKKNTRYKNATCAGIGTEYFPHWI